MFSNTPGVALPSTGSTGTAIYYIVGTSLLLAAGIMLRRKRRVTEHK